MLEQLTASLIADTDRGTTSATRELINPATEDAFHALADASREDVDRAAHLASQAWEQSWRTVTPGARTELLHRLANLIEANADTLASLDSRSMGKPLSAARGEVRR